MKAKPHLRQLCLTGSSQTLAIRAGVVYTGADLRTQALAIAAALQQRAEHTWALWLTSPYEFLCHFMGLALAGKRILLPGNLQPGTALALAPYMDGLLTRTEVLGITQPVCTPEQLLASASLSPSHEPLAYEIEHDIELVLFTSGSTGEPKAITKTLALLEAELAVLNSVWGNTLGQLAVLATVSHQHIYGLLHALLWPWWRAAPIVDELCQYPEELLARAQNKAPVVLISSPTHLKRLPAVADFAQDHQHIKHIISSGGLLDADAALALTQIMGHAPIEILGSTETGGVAWRQQAIASAWQALPGVSCQQDPVSECLMVTSAHLGSGSYIMGDRISLHADGRFSLRGRADQLVKVEGKRLSLTEMMQRLQDHAWVTETRILIVTGKREEVGAVVVLSTAGKQALASLGKLALNQQLREYLVAFFERPLLPRRWRYLAELPVNSQGKVVLQELQSLLFQRESL